MEERVSQRTVAVILASGSGERFGADLPKQFIKVAGRTILEHTIVAFERSRVDEIILVVNADHRSLAEELVLKNAFRKVKRVLNGGATRRESSKIAIDSIPEDDAKVLVHDAVRPFISERIIDDCVAALDAHDAVDVAIPSTDTIIDVDETRKIAAIPNRKRMMRGQTPQAFRVGLIRRAHALADREPNLPFTDDCGIVLHFQLAPIHVVLGEERNLKITFPEDVFLADKLFQLSAVEGRSDAVSAELVRGKVLVVLGASKGIGESILALAEAAGARVYGFSRVNGVDVRDYAAVEEALRNVSQAEGRIDYVANTAGVLCMGKLETRELLDVKEEIDINYLGAVNVVRAAVPHLRATRGSLLLFTSSSYTRGRALYSVYSSTKAAVVNLAQACSEECFADGVRINVLNPERTATPMRFQSFGKEPEGSLLSAEQVARVSLATLAADFTGQVVYVKK
jgi:2-C-methyl-D-erythritol 4-phosphate cytidylyltransferase